MGKINVGVVGIGNCASLFIQGIHYYAETGVKYPRIGGYKISDIKPVAGFDVDERKIGKDIADAIFAEPNNCIKVCDVPDTGAEVLRGPRMDGLGKNLESVVSTSAAEPADVADALKSRRVDVLINLLPVGSAQAARYYAAQALEAGCGFVNCIPEFIASDSVWALKFREKNLPLIGDDIKSMFGATIVHRVLAKLCEDRGAKIDRTYQLNMGGNTDFYNMLERDRLKSKKISKTEAVQSQLEKRLPDENIVIGPSDFIPWLKSRKICFIRIEGRLFADVPFNLDLRLDVDDKANAAGMIIDAVRCCKLAMDRKTGGALTSPSAYFMKRPPVQMSDDNALKNLELFINGEIER